MPLEKRWELVVKQIRNRAIKVAESNKKKTIEFLSMGSNKCAEKKN